MNVQVRDKTCRQINATFVFMLGQKRLSARFTGQPRPLRLRICESLIVEVARDGETGWGSLCEAGSGDGGGFFCGN